MELFGGNLTAFVEGRETMPDLTIFSNETFTLERMQKLEEEHLFWLQESPFHNDICEVKIL